MTSGKDRIDERTKDVVSSLLLSSRDFGSVPHKEVGVVIEKEDKTGLKGEIFDGDQSKGRHGKRIIRKEFEGKEERTNESQTIVEAADKKETTHVINVVGMLEDRTENGTSFQEIQKTWKTSELRRHFIDDPSMKLVPETIILKGRKRRRGRRRRRGGGGRRRQRRKTMGFDQFGERRIEVLENFLCKGIKRLSSIEGVAFGEKNGSNRGVERGDELDLAVNVGKKRKTASDQAIDALIAMIDKANKELKETKVKRRIFSCLIKDRE